MIAAVCLGLWHRELFSADCVGLWHREPPQPTRQDLPRPNCGKVVIALVIVLISWWSASSWVMIFKSWSLSPIFVFKVIFLRCGDLASLFLRCKSLNCKMCKMCTSSLDIIVRANITFVSHSLQLWFKIGLSLSCIWLLISNYYNSQFLLKKNAQNNVYFCYYIYLDIFVGFPLLKHNLYQLNIEWHTQVNCHDFGLKIK